MSKRLSAADRDAVVEKAEDAVDTICRQQRIRVWKKVGDDYEYTAKAQEIFNECYDYYEDLALRAAKRRRSR